MGVLPTELPHTHAGSPPRAIHVRLGGNAFAHVCLERSYTRALNVTWGSPVHGKLWINLASRANYPVICSPAKQIASLTSSYYYKVAFVACSICFLFAAASSASFSGFSLHFGAGGSQMPNSRFMSSMF